MRKFLPFLFYFFAYSFAMANPNIFDLSIETSGSEYFNLDEYVANYQKNDTSDFNIKSYDVKIYPNPVVNDQFTVKKGSENISSVEILNVIGQTIQMEENNDQKSEMLILLNKPEKGIYFVKIVFQNKKSIIKKVIIK